MLSEFICMIVLTVLLFNEVLFSAHILMVWVPIMVFLVALAGVTCMMMSKSKRLRETADDEAEAPGKNIENSFDIIDAPQQSSTMLQDRISVTEGRVNRIGSPEIGYKAPEFPLAPKK